MPFFKIIKRLMQFQNKKSTGTLTSVGKLLIKLFEKSLNLDNKISESYKKYPYTKVYDCSSNFAPITLFDINDMKDFK